MAEDADAGHVAPEELADYFAGILPDDRECTIDEHLAECRACTEEARQMHVLAHAWDSWTAPAHGAAYWQARVVGAIAAFEQRPECSRWRERLGQWRELGGRTEGAVRVVLAAAERASRVITEGLEALMLPGAAWRFVARAPAPVQVLGVTPPTRARATVALAPGTPQAQVSVIADAREVTVRVDGLRPGQTPPLVVLIPTDEGREPVVEEPQRQEGVDYLVARFTDVAGGEYLVALEPLARPDE